MATTMHAAVTTRFSQPLAFQDWPVPMTGLGQVLVKAEACGGCYTGLRAAHGDWSLKPTLPLVLVGLPPGEVPVPLFDMVANCLTIRGSFVGTREDMAEALAFAAQGKVHADIELQPLSAINSVLDRLERGKVPSRVVMEFGADAA